MSAVAWLLLVAPPVAPVPVLAAGRPIDIERQGHAAPFAGDLDGDGAFDLLVGEFSGGRLRVYRNLGTSKQPRFGEHTWFKAACIRGIRVPVFSPGPRRTRWARTRFDPRRRRGW
jgi:hypothetical protein